MNLCAAVDKRRLLLALLAVFAAFLFLSCSDEDLQDDYGLNDGIEAVEDTSPSEDDDSEPDDDDDDNGRYVPPDFTMRITDVECEDHNTYKLENLLFPGITGDLWPSTECSDGAFYTANGDGFGFGPIWSDTVFNVVEGYPPNLTGYSPPLAFGPFVAGQWGPEEWLTGRKPTGLICIDGDIYMFFQNLKNGFSNNPFGDAPHGSISMTRDRGLHWEWDRSQPMFTDYVFTTGWFLDYGRGQQYAMDDYVYVYGLDYNWRWADNFAQTKVYLARVDKEEIMNREAWEFYAGMFGGEPGWSREIGHRAPVIVDETEYMEEYSGICQGSVVYIPQLNRYLYSTRSCNEWIFWEAPRPWGPWTRVSVIEWKRGWTPDFHPGYPAVIPSKFLDEDGLGGWIISSLSSSTWDGMFYNMAMRRFWLKAELVIEE